MSPDVAARGFATFEELLDPELLDDLEALVAYQKAHGARAARHFLSRRRRRGERRRWARRVDGAEVKLDPASYRLRDRFFGSRVGRRALMAVALTFGRRGMALLEFQLRMRRLVGNGCVQPQGRRKAFRMSCTNAFSVRVRLRSRTQSCRSGPGLALPPTNAIAAAKEDRWGGAGRTPRAE